MRAAVAFGVALLTVAVQAALLRFFGGGAVSVSLPLAIVVYLGLHAGNEDGAVGAAAVGYVLDLMAGGPKGLMTFLAVALFLASRLAAAGLAVQGKGGFAILTGAGTFLYGAAALLLVRAVTPEESAPTLALTGRLAMDALLTGLFSPLVLLVMRRLEWLAPREEDPGLLR